jgi:long-chain acyl-CoA synthetase
MLVEGPRTLTWQAFHDRSSRVAQALLSEGVAQQDRVAIVAKNGIAFFEALFGAAKINAVQVSVNWRLAPAEMVHIINDAEARILFVGPDFAEQVASFEHQLTSVKRVVYVDVDTYGGWLDDQPADDPGIVAGPSDVAIQLYTSGTTGLPKGAMLTNSNFGAIMEFHDELGFNNESVNMVVMPLFHIGGVGWAIVGIASGGPSVIIRDVDPAVILRAFEEQHVTHTFLVPAVIMAMLAVAQAATTNVSALRYMAYGASPISERMLVQALSTFDCNFVQLYGMTETTGAITLLRPEEHDPGGAHPERLRSVGVPFRHVELRVVDRTTGEDAAVGEPGELWTRSAQNMKGYWHNPEATAATITPDGWLMTGDVGYVDGDGFFYLRDRVKDMIVSGGENIYPAEVENALMGHPALADCAVIGVPSDKWGETVKAIVVLAPGAEVTADELIEFTRTRIARFKVPRSVDFVDVLPRNPSGKILKRELREPYWRDIDRRVN